MKRYEIETKREMKAVVTNIRKLVTLQCDMCHRHGDVKYGWSSSEDDINDIVLSRLVGHDSRSGGTSTRREFDICPECYERIEHFIEDNGGNKPRIVESDW